MALRHGIGAAPAWTAGCLGPFLACVGLLAAATIAFGRPMTFGNGLALVVTLVLAAAGVWLNIDHFRGK